MAGRAALAKEHRAETEALEAELAQEEIKQLEQDQIEVTADVSRELVEAGKVEGLAMGIERAN
mgnify:CR=1 FL=1